MESLRWARSLQEFWQKTLQEVESKLLESGKSMVTARSSTQLSQTNPTGSLRLQKFSSGKDVTCEMKHQTFFQASLSLLIPEQKQALSMAGAQMRQKRVSGVGREVPPLDLGNEGLFLWLML